MSHSSVLVALDPQEIEIAGSVQAAVDTQMKPFDESGEWFKNGSRWDWYTIGGRFTGRLSGYDPDTDPLNYDFMGKRNWSNRPYKGDICLRKDIDITSLYQLKVKHLGKCYEDAMRDLNKGDHWNIINMRYGVNEGDTLSDFVTRCTPKPESSITHAAFLRDLHWHEGERLGWFGGTTSTECERQANTNSIETMIRRCKHKDKVTGASIVNWMEPWEIWSLEFWKRFVEPLPPTVTLVTVDYHV